MIDKTLLDILACPETRKPLREADAETVRRVNERIAAGAVTNRGGQNVTDPIQGGLVPEGGSVLYPIRDEIPILIIEEALPLA
jgi:uncharacterized protein YbaR (Trm112 family)